MNLRIELTRLKVRSLVSCLILPWLFTGIGIAVAQNNRESQTPYSFATKPTNCEINMIRMEAVTKVAIDGLSDKAAIIAIARLGKGEPSHRLNQRRLYNLRTYLTAYQPFPPEKIITAEGGRVGGYGRVEIYVSGKLVDVLLVNRGRDLCVECCDKDERYYPYRKDKGRLR